MDNKIYSIRFKTELYKYMVKDLNSNIKDKIQIVNNDSEYINFNIDVDTKLDIMEWTEDRQLEIGFVNEDYLNEDGEKLQAIYDSLYNQTNSNN